MHKKSSNSFQLDEVTGVVREMGSDDDTAEQTVPASTMAQVDRPMGAGSEDIQVSSETSEHAVAGGAEKTVDDEVATLKEELEVEVTLLHYSVELKVKLYVQPGLN